MRHDLGQTVIMSKKMIARIGRTVVHSVEPPSDERFAALCDQLGLTWVDSRKHPNAKLGVQSEQPK